MKRRVLVVDDNSLDVRLVRRCLPDTEYTVDGAPTLSSALLAIEQSSFDLILLDLNLPDGGRDEDVLVRVLGVAGSTPVVAFTGLADPARSRAVLERGAAGWLCKDDVDATSLPQSIRAILGG